MTNQSCKESPSAHPISGKLNCLREQATLKRLIKQAYRQREIAAIFRNQAGLWEIERVALGEARETRHIGKAVAVVSPKATTHRPYLTSPQRGGATGATASWCQHPVTAVDQCGSFSRRGSPLVIKSQNATLLQPGSTATGFDRIFLLADALPDIGRSTATMCLMIADATPTAAANEIACGHIGQSDG